MEKQKDLGTNRYLLKLTFPIFIELLLQMLVGNVDQFMVGKYSPLSVGAIGNANQILNVVNITFSIISLATLILVSQYLGSNNKKVVNQIYSLSVYVNFAFGILVTLFILLFNKVMFSWLQVPDILMTESRVYISIIASCIVLQALLLTFSAIFRSNKLMKETMLVSVVINIANIGFNILLINGFGPFPALGVAGAAIASCVSRGIGLLYMIWLFIKKVEGKVALSYLKPFPTDLLKKLLAIGIPSGGESLSYTTTQVFIQKFINGCGTMAITTKVYAGMFAMLSWMLSSAMSQAAQIIVGHMIGANQVEAADKRVRSTLKTAILLSFVVSIILYLNSSFLFGFFTKDQDIIKLGKTILFIEIFLEIGRAVNMVLVRALQATGDIKYTVTIGILSMWGISVGLSFILAIIFDLGLVGVWIAMAIDEGLRAIIYIWRWRSGAWKDKAFI